MQNELVQAGKMAALGELSAGITHELNQPLAAIGHYSHNARRFLERGDSDTAGENLNKISELTARMAKIINHLKTFARRPTNQLAPVTLATSIDSALSLLATPLQQGEIQIHRHASMPGSRFWLKISAWSRCWSISLAMPSMPLTA